MFLISTAIHLIAFLYTLFWIKESKNKCKNTPQNPQKSITTTPTLPQAQPLPKKNFILDFFDPTNPIQTFKIVFVHGQRLKISILLLVVIIVVGPMHGEQAVMYLYTRLKFNWNEVDYSFYFTFSTLITMCGECELLVKTQFLGLRSVVANQMFSHYFTLFFLSQEQSQRYFSSRLF